MYIGYRKKKNKWKVFSYFLIIFGIANLVYLEMVVKNFENVSHEYANLISQYNSIIEDDIKSLKMYEILLNEKQAKINEYEEIFRKEKIARLKVHITAYNPVPEQTDDTPEITAYGRKSRPGVIFAASDDIIKKLNLKPGVKMYIPGIPSKARDGMWVFGDKMHPRWKNRIDLMVKGKFRISRKHIVYIFI